MHGVFRRIGWPEESEKNWFVEANKIRALPSAEERELWARAPDIALRAATVLAVFCGRKAVEVEDFKWAFELVRHGMKQMARGLDQHYKDELDQADLIEHVRERFRSSRYLTIGEINKACERKTKDLRDIRRAINHLVECEEIKFLEPADGPGRPTERWEWRGKVMLVWDEATNNLGTISAGTFLHSRLRSRILGRILRRNCPEIISGQKGLLEKVSNGRPS